MTKAEKKVITADVRQTIRDTVLQVYAKTGDLKLAEATKEKMISTLTDKTLKSSLTDFANGNKDGLFYTMAKEIARVSVDGIHGTLQNRDIEAKVQNNDSFEDHLSEVNRIENNEQDVQNIEPLKVGKDNQVKNDEIIAIEVQHNAVDIQRLTKGQNIFTDDGRNFAMQNQNDIDVENIDVDEGGVNFGVVEGGEGGGEDDHSLDGTIVNDGEISEYSEPEGQEIGTGGNDVYNDNVSESSFDSVEDQMIQKKEGLQNDLELNDPYVVQGGIPKNRKTGSV